jgi:hypothetical protein
MFRRPPPSLAASRAQQTGPFAKIRRREIESHVRRHIGAAPQAPLLRARHKGRPHAGARRGLEIVGVGGYHQNLLRGQVEQRHGGFVYLPVGFVVPGYVGGEDAIPRQTRVAGHVGEQGQVAVR